MQPPPSGCLVGDRRELPQSMKSTLSPIRVHFFPSGCSLILPTTRKKVWVWNCCLECLPHTGCVTYLSRWEQNTPKSLKQRLISSQSLWGAAQPGGTQPQVSSDSVLSKVPGAVVLAEGSPMAGGLSPLPCGALCRTAGPAE